jgi:hypothetical protein
MRDIVRSPDRNASRLRTRSGRVDFDDASVRIIRAHDTHVQLVGERNAGSVAAAAGDERQVLEARDRSPDESLANPTLTSGRTHDARREGMRSIS